MKCDLTKVEFDQDDLNTLHDVIFNALDKEDLTNEQIMEYWNVFPEYIKLDALKFGICDTPTRDKMYIWLEKNVPNGLRKEGYYWVKYDGNWEIAFYNRDEFSFERHMDDSYTRDNEFDEICENLVIR